MLKTMTARATIAAILAGLSMSAYAIADSPKTVDIPAGELRQALLKVSEQFGTDLVYSPEQIQGIQTRGAHGELTTEQAISELLEGTTLELRTDPSGAMLIAPPAAPKTSSLSPGGRGTEGEEKKSFWSRLRLAQSDAPSPFEGEGGGENRKDSTQVEEYVPSSRGIPEVLVKGSRTLNMDIQRTRDDVQPYVVFDRETIEQSGAVNLDELMKLSLPMNSSASTAGRSPRSSINLRGLGANQTLILIDGHRAASYSTGSGDLEQPDINGIPLSAIERIEILPTTASGLYGGGATGGAINIVMRRDYSGFETKVGYGGAFDGGGANRRVDVSAGMNLEGGKTNILFTGSYSNSNPLYVSDRDFAERATDAVLENNPATFFGTTANPPLASTTNIRSNAALVNGVRPPLTLKARYGGGSIGSAFTYVPEGYAGLASDNAAALRSNAGQYNFSLVDTAQNSGGSRQVMIHYPTVKSAGATIRRELGDRFKAFLDVSGSENENVIEANGATSSFTLAANAANNPFNEAIRVTTPAFGADGISRSRVTARRAVGGVIFRLTDNWRLETDYAWNRTRFSSSGPDALTAAAGTAVSSGAIDVFKDTNAFAVDFGSFIAGEESITPTTTTLKNATVRLAGALPWALPAGAPTLTTLFEYRDEEVSDSIRAIPSQGSRSLRPGRSQEVDSVYAEVLVPIVGAPNAVPGIENLELQIAARRDAYSVTGATASINLLAPTPIVEATNKRSKISPTFALKLQPIRDVVLRGSYGEGFLPPSVTQLVPFAPFTIPASSVLFTDPRRGNERISGDASGNLTIAGGGNPFLQPEESESWSAGFILTPRMISGLRLSVDWTTIDKTDEITSAARFAQSDFDVEPFAPEVIIRDPAAPGDPFGVGRVTGFNTSFVNIASRKVEAYDFALDYTVDSEWGRFKFSSAATKLVELSTQLTPNSPVVDNAGSISTTGQQDAGLKWKGSGSLDWKFRQTNLVWTARYFDRYWLSSTHAVVANQGAASVPSQTYHDLTAIYSFGASQDGALGWALADTQIQLGIRNVFNKVPPLDLVGRTGAFGLANSYSAWGDPLLRSYYVTVRKQF